MVKVSVLRPPRETELGAKLLLKPGRLVETVRLVLAVPLFPALDVRSPDTLMCVPGVLLVTSTEMPHVVVDSIIEVLLGLETVDDVVEALLLPLTPGQ